MKQELKPILEAKNIKMYFSPKGKTKKNKKESYKNYVKANDDISLAVYPGETLSVVGESGCGKSTFGRAITKLYNPTDGQIIFDGKDITKMGGAELRDLRTEMQFIFQDPYSSLTPTMTVSSLIGEAMMEHGRKKFKALKKEVTEKYYADLKSAKSNSENDESTGKDAKVTSKTETEDELKKLIHDEATKRNIAYKGNLEELVLKIMSMCGLSRYMLHRYPHQFSGGQRQRVAIARSLALNPKFIVCDESVSALDVSIQSQIINLLKDLQSEFGYAYLFITHDLSVVKHISDRVAVLYLGKVVELATKDELFNNPKHPYTKALLGSIPKPEITRDELQTIKGEIPSNVRPPVGCNFNTRCEYATAKCFTDEPELLQVNDASTISCHNWDRLEEARREAAFIAKKKNELRPRVVELGKYWSGMTLVEMEKVVEDNKPVYKEPKNTNVLKSTGKWIQAITCTSSENKVKVSKKNKK